MQPTKTSLLNDYFLTVDSVYGTYLDAITGFCALVEEYDAAKSRMMAIRSTIPAEAFDGASFTYGTGHPSRPSSRVVHSCTQGEYRQRNDLGGRNHIVMGQLCLAHIYGFWEDCFRGQIAACCGKQKDDLKLDVMGDIRLLRNSIIHHRGVALKNVEACKLLKWFREGDAMILTPQHFEELIPRMKADLAAYVASI